jgi:hypothetical protein
VVIEIVDGFRMGVVSCECGDSAFGLAPFEVQFGWRFGSVFSVGVVGECFPFDGVVFVYPYEFEFELGFCVAKGLPECSSKRALSQTPCFWVKMGACCGLQSPSSGREPMTDIL